MIASEPAIQDTSVPMISGVKAGNILLGDTVVDKPILAALEYLNSLDESTFKNIAEVNIGDPDAIMAYTVSGCLLYTSVNLTDGLDGLAGGTSAVAAIAFSVIGLMAASMTNSIGAESVAYFGAIIAAVCLGFLVYNVNPAKVFMGDTGSLALGGAFAAMAILTKTELLLVVIGGIFVMEALSVIIQVISFKTRGVRVFKMSPIHHHFELSGWAEQTVVNLSLIHICSYRDHNLVETLNV